jgi:hypothetical protein
LLDSAFHLLIRFVAEGTLFHEFIHASGEHLSPRDHGREQNSSASCTCASCGRRPPIFL